MEILSAYISEMNFVYNDPKRRKRRLALSALLRTIKSKNHGEKT